ncbi:Metallo-hydrolase/oxidoreductase [Nemania sp. NC0429]|nr:Metallo-hydrolase/oxidoreductase [Nemania sp. NC0429]
MPPATSSFGGEIRVTHIGTATAIIQIDNDINLLTDPYFSPSGTSFNRGYITLTSSYAPVLAPSDLPPIDAVLLSHEDHPDNLDEIGRRLLDGRKVLTTRAGARALAPRPGVRGLAPWETVSVALGGRVFEVTGTPCKHLPGGECTGFVLTTAGFGTHPADGKPNAVYFSGDTVYDADLQLAERIREKWHVSLALLNLGAAKVPAGEDSLGITMDGAQASWLVKDLGADVVVPMHFEGWSHFTEGRDSLARAFDVGGIADRVVFLEPGVATRVL